MLRVSMTTMLPALLTAVATAIPLAVAQAGDVPKARTGAVLVNAKGFSVSAFPKAEIERIRVRFDRGFAIDVPRSRKAQVFGTYETVGGAQLFGALLVPGASGRRAELVGRRDPGAQTGSTATLRGTLTMGRRPVLTISDFPPGTTRVDFATSGPGRRGSRITSACKDRKRRVSGSMLITLTRGRTVPGTVSPFLLCGVGKSKPAASPR